MAKQAKRNYGADTSLIQGEAAMRQTSGFQNIAAAFDAPMKRMERMGAAIQRKNQARNAKVESYMSALNANIDVTALTEDDQKEVNNYLMNAKDEYAEAASAITNFKAGTPEYMEQLDIMNGVKNGLANLKTELDGFEQSKGAYLDEFKDLSQGNNSGRADTAANIFTGETRFSIGTGGHLHFTGSDGTSIPYTKLKMPFKKDYKQAMGFNDLFTPIYNSGLYDANKQRTFEDRIRIMAESNPDGMRSIIADGLTSHGDYQSLIPLLDDPANQEELTNKFISIASNAARQAANEGKIQKDKKQGSGGGYQPRIAKVKENAYKGPDGTVYKITTLSNNQKIVEDDFGNVYEGDRSKLTPVGSGDGTTTPTTPPAEEDINMKLVQGMMDQCGIDEATAIARVKNKQYDCP